MARTTAASSPQISTTSIDSVSIGGAGQERVFSKPQKVVVRKKLATSSLSSTAKVQVRKANEDIEYNGRLALEQFSLASRLAVNGIKEELEKKLTG
jgi:hypothetical protein